MTEETQKKTVKQPMKRERATWEVVLQTTERMCGKTPADPQLLIHIIMQRAKMEGKHISTKDALKAADEESEDVFESGVNTFYADEKGLFIKPMDIHGMIKERFRQMGITIKKKGYIGAIEGLRVTPTRIYLTRGGKNIMRPDGALPKPIHKWFGPPTVSLADFVEPPVEIRFTMEKDDYTIPVDEFIEIFKSCHQLGGLRKEYGTFSFVSVKKID